MTNTPGPPGSHEPPGPPPSTYSRSARTIAKTMGMDRNTLIRHWRKQGFDYNDSDYIIGSDGKEYTTPKTRIRRDTQILRLWAEEGWSERQIALGLAVPRRNIRRVVADIKATCALIANDSKEDRADILKISGYTEYGIELYEQALQRYSKNHRHSDVRKEG